jgi:hypothetical protein
MKAHKNPPTAKAKWPMLLVALAASVHAQDQAPKPSAGTLSDGCVARAMALFAPNKLLHDGVHKGAVPLASSEDVAKLSRGGAVLVRPFGVSTLTPPSSHDLLVLLDASDASGDAFCPLHRMYVRFTQGGFHPQPAVYHGPLRAGGA